MKRLEFLLFAVVAVVCANANSFTVDKLTYTTLDDEAHTVQLTKAGSQDAELKIPETVEYEGVTYTVTSVNLNVSSWNPNEGSRISVVTIPKTVEEIERLQGLNLTSVLFAEDSRLKTIEYGAFKSSGFKEISLPESVETIGSNAFYKCSKLTAIDIPDNVTVIKAGTFYGCIALTDIKLPSKLEVIEYNAFYSSSSMQRTIILPASLTSIGRSAFSYAELRPTGTVPPTLESGAFDTGVTVVIDDPALLGIYLNADGWKNYVEGPEINVDGLTYKVKSGSEAELIAIPNDRKSITIPEAVSLGELQLAVTSIMDGVLDYGSTSYHKAVEEIYIKAPVSSIGRQSFYSFGFRGAESILKHIELPESLQRIEDQTFQYCTQLKSIDIPDNVEYIGQYAFAYSAIETFTAPAKLTEIGNYMFFYCSSLKTATLHDNIKAITYGAFNYCSGLTELTLPAGLETISLDALGGTSVAELRIPHTVRDIYRDDVYGQTMMDSLKNIFITGGSNDKYFDMDGVLFRKAEGTDGNELLCYPNNRDAEEYTVPDGTVGILAWAFGRNIGKTDSDPTPLKRVSLPESVEHIDSYAFAFNHSLSDINLPKKLTSIGAHAFHFDRQVTVRIPESVTYVGDYAFGVNTVYIDAIQPPSCESNPFDGTICVKPEAVDAYKSHEAWGKCRVLGDAHEHDGMIYVANGQSGAELAGYVRMPGETLDIPQTVTIDGEQRRVTALGDNALNRAIRVNTVNIPETVDSIGAECFRLCGNMTSANIGNARVKWPNFLGCNKLQEITADENNIYHTTQNGVLYSKAMDTLQIYPLGAEREAYFLPEDVKTIGDYVMYDMSANGYDINLKLQKLYSLSQTPPVCGASSFTVCSSRFIKTNLTLYVPENLVKTYINENGWGNIKFILGLSDEEISDILAGVNEIEADGNGLTGADDVFYTISGQRVTKPGKGLYIRNGRKVVIK